MELVKIFLSCRETSRRIAQGEFNDASLLVKIFIALHLLYCRYCRRYLREMRLLARAARLWAGGLIEEKRLRELEARLIRLLP